LSERSQLAKEEQWYALDVDTALTALSSNSKNGLTDGEAKSRLERYGLNTIKSQRKASSFKLFVKQFKNLLIAILLIATIISAFLGEVIDAVVILAIVFFAVVLGFLQEFRAEQALESLKKMLSPTCAVVRNGTRREIPAEELVPGDILLLEAGDRVDADARIIEAFNLQIDEAPLTGESIPIQKSTLKLDDGTILADRVNVAYAGTTVTQGRGKALVTDTGMQTEFGKIATEVANIETEETPLERRMEEIGDKLGRISLVLVTIIAVGGLVEEYLRTGTIGFSFVVRIFLFAVALAVAAVPEALPAIVTGSLAIGMRIMAKRNALVRKMPAVETLGSTQVICSDKTGTLTRGEMTVREVFTAGTRYEITGEGYEPKGTITQNSVPLTSSEALERFSKASILCSDAVLSQEGDRWLVRGDTTEGALLTFAEKIGIRANDVRNSNPRVGELPFSSERKRLTTINVDKSGKVTAYMKGAPEIILSICASNIENGQTKKLTERDIDRAMKLNEEMAKRALRVLGVAEKTLDSVPTEYSEQAIESNFTFLGLAGINDPPRQDAIEAVKAAKAVGMKPVMISGDHKLTALAVARETGIYEEGNLVLTGEELDRLPEAQFEDELERISVYARVSPSHKLRIVDAWKKKGKVVAMTGDGVNDAPALKKADIGIAMGITGTDVTKEASDLVLADDNFATIIKAIEVGRWIYDNIKKYLAYLLQGNFVEIAVMTIASLLILPLMGLHGDSAIPLLAVQILYINLATDGLPAIALGFSPPDPDLMKRPPRPRNESVFTKDVTRLILMALIVQTPILILGFTTGLSEGLIAARSRLFLMFIGIELAIALNCRSLTYSMISVRPHKWVVLAVIWESILISILTLIPPTRIALGIVVPSFADLQWIFAAAIETMVSIELLKIFLNKHRITAGD
jgi:Ca2+-transporting ATPase